MQCPECDYHVTDTLDTRPQPGGWRRRRRKCFRCGHKFSTAERVIVTKNPWKKVNDQLDVFFAHVDPFDVGSAAHTALCKARAIVKGELGDGC